METSPGAPDRTPMSAPTRTPAPRHDARLPGTSTPAPLHTPTAAGWGVFLESGLDRATYTAHIAGAASAAARDTAFEVSLGRAGFFLDRAPPPCDNRHHEEGRSDTGAVLRSGTPPAFFNGADRGDEAPTGMTNGGLLASAKAPGERADARAEMAGAAAGAPASVFLTEEGNEASREEWRLAFQAGRERRERERARSREPPRDESGAPVMSPRLVNRLRDKKKKEVAAATNKAMDAAAVAVAARRRADDAVAAAAAAVAKAMVAVEIAHGAELCVGCHDRPGSTARSPTVHRCICDGCFLAGSRDCSVCHPLL